MKPDTPYVKIDREKWKRLRKRLKIDLTQEQLDEIQGLNEKLSMEEVREIYAPLSRLLKVYYDNYRRLNETRREFLGIENENIPYIIGIAGSVAVGKSTTARILKKLISLWPEAPNVYIVTTDGFLYNNSELERRGILDRKGFPESYNLKGMLSFLYRVKSGENNTRVPIYSHLIYDIVEGKYEIIKDADIIIFEGLNVLQTHTRKIDGANPDLMVSDFFDFSIYVDAEEDMIKKWFIERFLKLKRTAFTDPQSYFKKYSEIDDETSIRIASQIWDNINGKNLKENIEGTKYHADLIMKKVEDHSVRFVLLRKI
ncbi:type I pantothenate kinase [Cuniculiplasma sp. SKW3]|uniref:type I pantothenate kinase n=1 Tax=Cuniculiplasma sp. SKW3 TaxID=3400170 RepID=UPI003FD39867